MNRFVKACVHACVSVIDTIRYDSIRYDTDTFCDRLLGLRRGGRVVRCNTVVVGAITVVIATVCDVIVVHKQWRQSTSYLVSRRVRQYSASAGQSLLPPRSKLIQ